MPRTYFCISARTAFKLDVGDVIDACQRVIGIFLPQPWTSVSISKHQDGLCAVHNTGTFQISIDLDLSNMLNPDKHMD
jgi:hypothetical protein